MKKYAISLAAVSLFGCNAPEAVAPKRDLIPAALRSFPPENISFESAKFFLWKTGTTPQMVTDVQNAGKVIENNDWVIFNLNRDLLLLNAECDAVAECQTKRDELLAKNDEIAMTDGMLREAVDEASRSELAGQRETQLGERATLGAQLEALKTGLGAKIKQSAELQEGANRAVAVIEDSTDWFKQSPTGFNVKFNQNGKVGIKIFGWRGKNYKSDDDTIVDATYNEMGGVLKFTVLQFTDSTRTRVFEKYEFNLRRFNYARADLEKRIYVTGDITLKIEPDFCDEKNPAKYLEACTRKGVVKLINRKNLEF